jgi:hypothetical protein
MGTLKVVILELIIQEDAYITGRQRHDSHPFPRTHVSLTTSAHSSGSQSSGSNELDITGSHPTPHHRTQRYLIAVDRVGVALIPRQSEGYSCCYYSVDTVGSFP